MATISNIEAEAKNTASDSKAEVHTESNELAPDVGTYDQKAGFSQWETVTKYHGPNKLYRSSSPNYDEDKGDASQVIKDADLKFLKTQGIQHVICLNSDELSSYKIGVQFANATPKIEFTRIPVEDYHSPTLAQMETAYKAYVTQKKDTLVWCGFGYGRTGTMITALQYKNEKGKVKFSHNDYLANHVEQMHMGKSTMQFETLDKLQK